MSTLIRVRREEPVYQFRGILIGEPGPGQAHAARHYDYVSPDGRWLVQPNAHACGGAKWEVIDTTNGFRCDMPSLDHAKEFIERQ
jgi:hypothetical protein